MTGRAQFDSGESPPPRRPIGLRLRLWIGCLGGALVGGLAVACVMAALTMMGDALDPRTVLSALAFAVVLGVSAGALFALWIQRGVAESLWRVNRGLAAGHLPEPQAGASGREWGEIGEVAERVRAMLLTNRRLAYSEADYQQARAEISKLCESVERWVMTERWEPLTASVRTLLPLTEGLNRGFARATGVQEQNREAARLVRADLLKAIEDTRASATAAEHGFVEATAMLTTIREIARLEGEIEQALRTSDAASAVATARDEERWREEAARSLEELAGESSQSVEHLGNGLLRVQEIASQVQLLSNRATLIALNALVAVGRPAKDAGSEGWNTELKQLARDVRGATDRVQQLTAEVEREVESANERMRAIRERVAARLSELPGVESAPRPAPAPELARLAERLREMIQDAARKGERLSEEGEHASRDVEALARRLQDEARDLEGLIIRLAPIGDDASAHPQDSGDPGEAGSPRQRLRLIEEKDDPAGEREDPRGREDRS
jgi:methyl-accepting chemotaxis protein